MVTEIRESESSMTSVCLRILGSITRMVGDPGEALRLHQEALTAIPEGPKAERERMLVLAEIGLDQVDLARHAEAADSLEQSLERFERFHRRSTPQRADALLGLGRARMGLGQPDQALETLQRVDAMWREWDPGGRSAEEAALWLGRCRERLGRN